MFKRLYKRSGYNGSITRLMKDTLNNEQFLELICQMGLCKKENGFNQNCRNVECAGIPICTKETFP